MTCPLCGGEIVGDACTRCGSVGRRLDYFVACEVGVPVDIGWAIVVLNADETSTRTCKGCGATVTSRVVGGEVERVPVAHADGCPVFARLANNPGLS